MKRQSQHIHEHGGLLEINASCGNGMRICLVSSCGGHLAELLALQPAYKQYDHVYVINERIPLPHAMEGRTYVIRHGERNLIAFLNVWEAWRIIRRVRPSVILTTGASPGVAFALVGKLFRIPTIFVEISAQVTTPSATGRMMARLADTCFYQWPSLARYFPRGVYGGLLR